VISGDGGGGDGADPGGGAGVGAVAGHDAGGDGGARAEGGTGLGGRSAGGAGADSTEEGGAAGAGGVPACSATYELVLGGKNSPYHCFSNGCPAEAEQLNCTETCLTDSECTAAGETWYAVFECRAVNPGRDYTIGNPPPADEHCSTVECPPGYYVSGCEDTCAGNPRCLASQETWYAHLHCELCE
jgi:hypothetical protein